MIEEKSPCILQLPCFLHSNSQSSKAGQRVWLATYCPWVTGSHLKSWVNNKCQLIFSRVLRYSTPRFVGQLVCLSVGWSVTLYFFYDFYFWTSLLLPKWSSDLKYGPCPPARDFGSRVSGLVSSELATLQEAIGPLHCGLKCALGGSLGINIIFFPLHCSL